MVRSPDFDCTVLKKLKDAKPLTAPMCYAGTSNVRRYYEKIRLPERLLVIGDSAAAFNPVSAEQACISVQPAAKGAVATWCQAFASMGVTDPEHLLLCQD